MKYVYYDETTGQVEAVFDTPKLGVQKNWADKGLLRSCVPPGLIVTRDHRLTEVGYDEGLGERMAVACVEQSNQVQPDDTREIAAAQARERGLAKIYRQSSLTQEEIDAQG